ncbi:outer membrane cobalamin receptor [Mucilaginibacter yixingensis]|uniref:Outer membrane cobalamin receptor n=1 Tax=Mucilaginibacter yixingensis TaxID=1295612 RepID=A0A2T5JBN6_9SPHI|nr:TonB-dependent receptor [Mucilaginibacter yixingensis]PTQ98189.1 outer membrane cobalamin receptor [Mucilaginibacter yixingensis]
MKPAWRSVCLLLLFLPMGIASARAQKRDTTKTDTLRKQHLKEVQVKGLRKNQEKDMIPVQTLSGQQLKDLSTHSVADAVRYFSGVQVKDYGGIGGLKTVNVRSLGTQHVGVFYDGIELGNAQNGVVDLGRFSLDNMEAISLYNGQKSAIFQPAKDFSSASAIYLTTRVPKFEDDKKDNYQFAFKTGSFGLANPSVLWEHQLRDSLSTSFNAEYLYTNGRYKFIYAKAGGYDTTQTRQNGDVRALRLEGGLFGRVKDGEWSTKLYFYNSGRGYPGAVVRSDTNLVHQDRQWDDNFFVQSAYQKKFSSLYSLRLSAKYAYDYLHYLSDPRLDVSTLYINNHFRQQEVYLSAANLFQITPHWYVNLSEDGMWNKLNADLVDFVYPTRYTSLTALATTINLGRVQLQGSLLETFVHETTRVVNSAAGNTQQLTPSLIAAWRPLADSAFSVRAFYKRIFRMPTLNDLYYTFIGNINLKPEYTTQYDLGFRWERMFNDGALRSIELQVDGYYNQVQNKIIAVPTTNQYRWTMINLGYVKIRGIDVSAQGNWALSAKLLLSTRLSYTYQRAQDFTDVVSPYYGGQIPYEPWNSGSVVMNLSYGKWNVNYSYIYTGERYDAIANIPENYHPPFYTHDIALTRTLQLSGKQFRLSAEINNLLNQQYEVVQSYPMPGTNIRLIIQMNL